MCKKEKYSIKDEEGHTEKWGTTEYYDDGSLKRNDEYSQPNGANHTHTWIEIDKKADENGEAEYHGGYHNQDKSNEETYEKKND